MTGLEEKCLYILLRVRDAWTRRFISRHDFMSLMEEIVKIISSLEAKQLGCPTGSHFGDCDCKPAVVGHGRDWIYRKSNKLIAEASRNLP